MTSQDQEREIHIEDCQHLWQTSYERFQLHGCPTDRDEALQHLHRMNEAILGRSAAVQAQRHAEFEQRLADGPDYFAAVGQRDRERLQFVNAVTSVKGASAKSPLGTASDAVSHSQRVGCPR